MISFCNAIQVISTKRERKTDASLENDESPSILMDCDAESVDSLKKLLER